MHLFSTILFVDGNPVRYDIRLEADRLLLLPIDNPNNYLDPPSLFVYSSGSNIVVKGTTERDLIDQVVEDICSNAGRLPDAFNKLC